eukprot:14192298-Ditylum_brightwellii.AAC.1
MVHPCKHTLVGVDGNNIDCLTPHSNSAGTEGTMLFHGVDESADGGNNHLILLTQAIDCCLKARMEQNMCSPNAMINRSVLFGSAKSTGAKEDDEYSNSCFNGCVADCFDGCVGHVDDGKEDSVDDSVDGGDKHLTHLTQFENNDTLCGCDKPLTHVVKKHSESLISDVT